jgi:hypothetical protein
MEESPEILQYDSGNRHDRKSQDKTGRLCPRQWNGRSLKKSHLKAAALLAATLLAASGAHAATLRVGPGQPFREPSQAMAKASDGDTIRIEPGTYSDCAVLRQNHLTFEGSGPAEKVVLAGKTCLGKAILVTDGHDITIRRMTLAHARVPDGNGAGIRMEGANLTVDDVRFLDNQDGILTAAPPHATLTVRRSLFLGNGTCEQACAHGIYAGKIDQLVAENSKFLATQQGHHIKSRAKRSLIIGNDIEDGPDGTASYLVDIPNGGDLVLRNNTLEKGPNSGNQSVAVVIGEEGATNPTREITVRNNSFRRDGEYPTVFVHNFTATPAMLFGNALSGGMISALEGSGTVH